MESTEMHLNDSGLAKLLNEIEKFPSSLNESTMLYNFNKLLVILQEKELVGLVKDKDMISLAHNLSHKFNSISQKINRKSTGNAQILALYKKAQNEIENKLSGPLYIFATQWGLSVLALYYYKNGNYNNAINKSLECIILSEQLIRTGISTLLFRAAEQNKNIMRVLFRSSDWKIAANFAHDFLKYLFNGNCKLQNGKIFFEKKYWNQNVYVREGYSYECFRSIVSLTIRLEKRSDVKSKELFMIIFSDLCFEVNNSDREIIFQWLQLKRLFYSGEHGKFEKEFVEFMKIPISKIYDILKISLILDAQKIFIDPDFPQHGERVKNRLTRFMFEELDAEFYLNTDLSTRNLVKQ